MNNLLYLLDEVRFRALQVNNRPLLSLKEHKDIALALLNRNKVEASAAIAYHLRNVEKDILTSIKQWTFYLPAHLSWTINSAQDAISIVIVYEKPTKKGKKIYHLAEKNSGRALDMELRTSVS